MGLRCWAVLAGVASTSAGAFVNLDFETVDDSALGVASLSTGWRVLGPLGPGLDGIPNLSGWAEAYRTSQPGLGVSTVIFGKHSVAFESWYARSATVRDSWPGWEDLGYSGYEPIGSVFIGQAGWMAAGVTTLSFLTDYSGPHYPDPSDPPLAQDVGELALYFDDEPIGFWLEPYDSPGGTLNRILADLTPFAGRYGELRMGVEGPHRFVIDRLRFESVPESAAGRSLGILGMILALGAIARRCRRSLGT